LWVVRHLRFAKGVFFFKSLSWNFKTLPDSVLKIYTDASGAGLAFWIPSLNIGFQSHLPGSAPTGTIFYFEALAIMSALLDATKRLWPDGRVAIFSSNLNSVAMFNLLAALPPYNWLLMTSVDAILEAQIDFRVFFVPGVENIVADHLSCWHNLEAIRASSGSLIYPFSPPRICWGQ
jgi:hypothetical protein